MLPFGRLHLLLLLFACLPRGISAAGSPANAEQAWWPDPAFCDEEHSRDQRVTVADRLLRRSEETLAAFAVSPLFERLQSLQQRHRFQEMIWLLDEAGEYAAANSLAASLYCFYSRAPIKEQRHLSGGATESRHVIFADLDLQGVFKPSQNNYSASIGSEIGAYRLDRLLHLNLVPLTLRRTIEDKGPAGSLQYFIKDCVSGLKLAAPLNHKPGDMLLLDYFGKNIDRDPKNYMYQTELKRFVAIDNGWCLRGNNLFAKIKAYFVDKRSGDEQRLVFPAQQRPAPAHVEFLRRLSPALLTNSLQGIVSAKAIEKLIKRKAKVLHALGFDEISYLPAP